MIPNTQYDMYVDGVLMNAFCKPYGKNLGNPMISGPDVKLLVQYHMGIPYNHKYLVPPTNISGLMTNSKMIQFVDPF
jgi:hypothetical protein